MLAKSGRDQIIIQEESGVWSYEIRDGVLGLREDECFKALSAADDYDDFWDAFFEVYGVDYYGDEILNVLESVSPLLKEVGIDLSRIERMYLNRTYEVLLGIKIPGVYENYRLYSSMLEEDGDFEDDLDYLSLNDVEEWKASYRQELKSQLAQLN